VPNFSLVSSDRLAIERAAAPATQWTRRTEAEQLALPGLLPAAGHEPHNEVPVATVRSWLQEMIDPLTTVVGYSDLLLDEGLGDEQRRAHARLVYEAGREIEQTLRRALGELQLSTVR
jgi:hypothetical protein